MGEDRLPAAARLQRELARLGPAYAKDIAAHSAEVKALFAPLLADADNSAISVKRDLAYGAHPRQVLDVFVPAGAESLDVVVFVHGGAFIRGARSGEQGLYDNVLYWFAKQGFVGVNMEYRLAPEATYPEGACDVAAALDWVQEHIGAHGGNPERVLLIGHSAGGAHAASLVVDPALPATRKPRALVLISARLRADVSPDNPNAQGVRAYFGSDESRYEARSAVSHAARCATPVMVVVAEFENPWLDVYGLEFAHQLARASGRAPRVLQCLGHNHMSVVAHFNTADEALGREILAFWNAC